MIRNMQNISGINWLFVLLFWVASTGAAFGVDLAEELNAFGQKTFQVLSARDYAGLEKIFNPYLVSYEKNKISEDELSMRFSVFSGMFDVESELDGWVQAYPTSYAARLAHGIYYVEEAWRKRGDLMGDRTSNKQFAGFNEYLKKSHAELTASLRLYARPVESYRYLIRVAKGQDGEEERQMLDLALRLDPAAVQPRLEYLDAVTPRWGGDEKQMAAVLKEGKQSRMSAHDKAQLEGRYYLAMAQDARLRKNYRAGSDYFYMGYKASGEENALLFSAEIAIDAEDPTLALDRLNELLKVFPKSANGYDYRAKVYEYKFNDMEHAVQDYVKAADLGSAWSQNHIGWFYMKGIKVPVDFKKARRYLELSANQGNRTAKENLVILNGLEQGK